MFGTFRFLLSLLVVLSHFGRVGPLDVDTFNVGLWAVVSFFLLSGYVMSGLLTSFGGDNQQVFTRFYLDRFLRIYPQYLFFLLITFLVALTIHLTIPTLHKEVTLLKLLCNLLIIPMNYVQEFPTIERYQLIPPAWSLAVEVQYYLLCPLLFFRPKVKRVVWLFSFAVFCLGAFNILNRSKFTFSYFPSALFIFLFGMRLYEERHKSFFRFAGQSSYSIMLALAAVLQYFDLLKLGHLHEVFLGFFIGAPIISYLGKLPRRKWDEKIGNIAYGVFLSHQLIIWINRKHLLITDDVARVSLVVSLSILMGILGYYLVEKPYDALRKNLRRGGFPKLAIRTPQVL